MAKTTDKSSSKRHTKTPRSGRQAPTPGENVLIGKEGFVVLGNPRPPTEKAGVGYQDHRRRRDKTLTGGQKAPVSGVYERTVVQGAALPPAPKSEHTLRTKSGGYVLKSPVRSANTVSDWSRAFKKK